MSDDKYHILTAYFLSGLEGNQQDYTLFLTAITPIIRRIISKKIAHADREDVVQEILISIHKARHTYNGERPLMPWISSICHFRMMDYLRKYYTEMRHAMCDITDMQHISADAAKEEIGNESLATLFKHIPQKQQKILTMMHLEGYSAKEVGNHIGMNESAVKVAAHRAIHKIRAQLDV